MLPAQLHNAAAVTSPARTAEPEAQQQQQLKPKQSCRRGIELLRPAQEQRAGSRFATTIGNRGGADLRQCWVDQRARTHVATIRGKETHEESALNQEPARTRFDERLHKGSGPAAARRDGPVELVNELSQLCD